MLYLPFDRQGRWPGILSVAIMIIALILSWNGFALAENPVEQGQQPTMIVKGAFRFVRGSWAKYWIVDRNKGEKSLFYFAAMDRIERQGRPAIWLEVSIKPEKQDEVATRILAAETPDGPGELFKVIVQPTGYEPFTVPESFLRQQGGDGQYFRHLKNTAAAAKQKRVSIRGRSVQVWEVNGTDENGRAVSAVVSEEVPPLGLVHARTADVEMHLHDWGTGATSLIRGSPMNFYLWLATQAGKAMSKE